jgi:hypothetical protein
MDQNNFNNTQKSLRKPNKNKRKHKSIKNRFTCNNGSNNNNNNTNENSDSDSSLVSPSHHTSDTKFMVCIGNLLTDQIETREIDELIQTFLEQNIRYEQLGSRGTAHVIDSIRVFTNAIYVCFSDESLAIDASSFLNNYNFKEFELKACLIFNSKANNSSHNNYDQLEENGNSCFETNGYSFSKNRNFTHKLKLFNDCLLLIENRQLKNYADSVSEKVSKELLGLNIFPKYLNDELKPHHLPDTANNTELDNKEAGVQSFVITRNILKEAIDRSHLYIIYLNQSNEQYNSINFLIINKWRHGEMGTKFASNNNKKNFGIKEYKICH